MSLTEIGLGAAARPPEALDETARATEPTMNSRLENHRFSVNSFEAVSKQPTLEQKRYETPRPFQIVPIGVTESRSERRLLDGYAIGIGKSQERLAATPAQFPRDRPNPSKLRSAPVYEG